MNVRIDKNLRGKTVAVAVSGGADSMALLHFIARFDGFPLKVVALNVEHGIRGETSLRDTAFVKDYCAAQGIRFIGYSVTAPAKARAEKISVEQAARILRYECFADAIDSGKCDAVLTAHHSGDNAESVLFNLFRGTGVKGLTGIKDFGNRIYRPFIKVSKAEITRYVRDNGVPFVDDETNFSDDYTRNFLRLNVIPKIKEVFPEVEKSVSRLSETLAAEDEYLDSEAEKLLSREDGVYYVSLPAPRALCARAVIKAVNRLGITHDYEKTHVDEVCALADNQNGKFAVLPKGVKAVREYDRIALYVDRSAAEKPSCETPFSLGKFTVGNRTVTIKNANGATDLKSGLYADASKIPADAVIRTRRTGDVFRKFGGGSKSLSDFLTDKKIPRKDRDALILIASGENVLAICGVAVSDSVKVDGTTRKTIQIL